MTEIPQDKLHMKFVRMTLKNLTSNKKVNIKKDEVDKHLHEASEESQGGGGVVVKKGNRAGEYFNVNKRLYVCVELNPHTRVLQYEYHCLVLKNLLNLISEIVLTAVPPYTPLPLTAVYTFLSCFNPAHSLAIQKEDDIMLAMGFRSRSSCNKDGD